ncbi:tetratricopeptide repeat protein [Streptomyces sp. NPDC048232]|uniref:tetratricopeptide repeat protein n=1 Tax=Streptomyces sp. NPDC048232 TaxID=3365520 RepID=UPI0037244083
MTEQVPQQERIPGQQASGNTESTILQAGHDIRINALGPVERAVAVSVAPPLGRRDPATPLRGRAAVLDELSALLDPSQYDPAVSRVRVLHGLGGCGKTSIALDLTYFAAERGIDVWWVSAVDAITLTAGMHAVARRIGASKDELLHGDAPDVLWRRLDAYGRNWLLVVDNADDPEILASGTGRLHNGQGWVRPHTHRTGLVVVTSRDGNPDTWGTWCALRSVGMLDNADATRVLLDYTADRAGSATEAAALAHRLNGLPIVLRLAGAYLADTTMSPWPGDDAITSFAGYLNALDDGRLDIYDGDGSGIGRSWELSLDLLARQGIPQVRPLLRLLSCLADAPVAYSIILDPQTLTASPLATLFEGLDGNVLWRLLKSLANLCLIDLSEPVRASSQRLLRVHPLVREASRHHLNKPDGQITDYVQGAIALLHRAVETGLTGAPEWPPAWPLWQAISPHALHVARTASAMVELTPHVIGQATGAAHLVARHLRSRGQFATAEAEYRFLLDVQGRVLGADHPLTLATHHSIGGVLHDRGMLTEAEVVWRTVLQLRQQALGEGHADTLFTRHGLALVMHDQGKLPEAEAEWRAVLLLRINVLGERHPHTLATRHSLAGILHQRGQYEEAESEYRRVLEIQREVVGSSHPDALATRHRIAVVLHDRGELAQAEEEFRTVLELRRRVLGEDHPHTLATSHGIAVVLHGRGEFGQAEEEFRSVLELRRRVLGEDHPHTLETRFKFALTLMSLEQLGSAEAEYAMVLRARVRRLGEDHSETMAVRLALEELRTLSSSRHPASAKAGEARGADVAEAAVDLGGEGLRPEKWCTGST